MPRLVTAAAGVLWSGLVTVGVLSPFAMADAGVGVKVTPSGLAVEACQSCGPITITISGPDRRWHQRTLDAGQSGVVALAQDGEPLPDGEYTYEVRAPRFAAGLGDRTAAASSPWVGGGRLRVVGGVATAEDRSEVARGVEPQRQVIADDLVVQGYACVGPSCAANEPLAPQLKLKGPAGGVPRLVFDVADPDANDWSASASVGQFYVGPTGHIALTLSDAPESSLYLDYYGRFGVGTTTPAATLHVHSYFTPSLRLDQSGGSFPGAWDIYGGGDSFSVVDAGSSGTRMSLSRTTGLHVPSLEAAGGNGTAQLRVTEASTTMAARRLVLLKNNGPGTFRFENSATGQAWGFGSLGSGNFFIGAAIGQPLAFTLTPNGDVALTGTLTQGSDRDSKQAVVPVDPASVLERVARLPLATWEYKGAIGVRHVGPMAQDFAAEFGLGADDKHIAPGDAAGVSLAAIQALKAENELLSTRLDALEAQLQALAAR